MPRTFGVLVSALLLALAALPAPAATHEVPVMGGGRALVLDAPDEWRARARVGEAQVQALELSPAEGGSFLLLVSAFPPRAERRDVLEPAALRERAAAGARNVLASAVETELPLRDLEGPAVQGTYFSATDRAPKPGEYRHLTQALLASGGNVVTVTLLSNDDAEGGPGALRERALGVIASLRPVAD